VPVARDLPLPLSFAQQRLWFLAQLDARASAAYLMPTGVRLVGSLDESALRQALNRIVTRHEALRTRFVGVQGSAVQEFAPPGLGLPLRVLDLSVLPDPQDQARRLAEEEACTPFDLAQAPLIRAVLLKLAAQDHILLLTMHHIISDGWSMGVLVNEFSALYAAFSTDLPDPLPALPIQYADFAAWQHRWVSGALLQRQLEFWRAHLHGAPALLELPTDRPRPPTQDYAGATLDFALSPALSAQLKALAHRHGCTLFMTLLAAWATLLARLAGQSEVVIGSPTANRHRTELEPLIGFFVNTQALRIDLSNRPSVAQLLAQVRATALAAQDHQDLPFEQLIEALNPPRSLAHHPL
ncbi:MAG: non-ribosomal peptide synthetase, partial [Burkholderiales bacterium]|nr:non-ribosomal peptide synthetase [Burkholderiales bacterium]